MKRAVLSIILVLLVSLSASASIFDGITGKAAEETETINEEVKCVFKDTKLEQGCYSDDKQFSCSGIDSCIVNVSGEKGQKLKWKSICEDREITTKIDGIHEIAEFKCEEKYDFLRAAPPKLMLFEEQVKCVFADSDSEQKCYSDDNRFSCSEIGSCTIDIAAPGYGQRIIWKSTCGGFAYTTLNQTNKTIEFNCQEIKEPYVYEIIEEDVRCIFANSTSDKMCYPLMGKVSCSGTEECAVRISEDKGKIVRWQSSCDRYDYLFRAIQYTVMDGNPEHVEFICRPLPNIILNSGKIYAYLFYRGECSKDCKKIEKGLLGYKEKYPQLEVKAFDMAIPENEELFSNIFFNRGVGPEYLPVLFMAGATASSMRYDKRYMDDLDFMIRICVEHGDCPNPFRSKQEIFVEKNYERYTRVGTWCLFDDPELVKKCTENYDIPECSNTVRECYTENNEFGCKWDGGIVASEDGRKYAYCIARTAAPENTTTNFRWKSSCGGYATTLIDSFSDYAEFKCVQSANITPEDISGKGFLHAYWKCQDGTEQKSAEGATVCKTTEEWKGEASAFCSGKCFKNSMLCGLDEFSVAGECYAEPKEEPIPSPVEQKELEKEKEKKDKEEELKKEKPEEPKKPEEKEEFLFCKDSCPFEGKCYVFGYRKEGKFCSDEGLFVEQLTDDTACENNFECSTNVCVDGRCIGSGLIQRVIDWLRSLFG